MEEMSGANAKKKVNGKAITKATTKGNNKNKQPKKRKVSTTDTDSASSLDIHLQDDDDDVDDKACCCVGCDELYNCIKRVVDWIKCLSCQLWLHEDCSKYESICHKCGKKQEKKLHHFTHSAFAISPVGMGEMANLLKVNINFFLSFVMWRQVIESVYQRVIGQRMSADALTKRVAGLKVGSKRRVGRSGKTMDQRVEELALKRGKLVNELKTIAQDRRMWRTWGETLHRPTP
ncbi:hypothetical protein QE152_g18977 [Popillia japonica]|uniref:Zinc finger PHD-type domain-containing protein n=1 Tax=Popillia japonica TaxID=7064 RepID=A0AAW1KZ19_POPJA